MIWLAATLMLAAAAAFALWPLLTHWTPEPEAPAAAGDLEEVRLRELEESELDR